MDVLLVLVLLLQGGVSLAASKDKGDCINRGEVQLLLQNMETKYMEVISSLKEEIQYLKRDNSKFEGELRSLRELTESLLEKIPEATEDDSDVDERTNGNPIVDSMSVEHSQHEIVSDHMAHAELASVDNVGVEPNKTGIKRFVVADGAAEGGVAFTVVLSKVGLTHLGANQPIRFDKVISNLGNAFDNNISVFQVPVNGWYVFSLTLMSRPNEVQQLKVVQNDVEKFHCFSSGNEYNTASKTVVLHANVGDDILVQAYYADSNVHGIGHTSFTGFLLYRD